MWPCAVLPRGLSLRGFSPGGGRSHCRRGLGFLSLGGQAEEMAAVFVVMTEDARMSAAGAADTPEPGGEVPAPGVQRLRVATQDPVEGREILGRVYNARDLVVAPDRPFSLVQAATVFEQVSLARVRLIGAPASGGVDATGTVHITQVLGGRLGFTDGTATRCGPVPFVMPVRPYTCRWEDLDSLTVSLDAAGLAEFAAGLAGVERFVLRFTGTTPVSPAMARHWAATVAHLDRVLLGNEEALASPLLRAEAFRSLATAALHTFPTTFLEDQTAVAPPAPAPAAIRRAIAFMEAHLDADIGLVEIAAEARLSPRGLQAAFRREKGTTPLAHLRALRLEAAHADLVAGDPATGVSVAGIAARWGFAHPGRFAGAYRQAYGQSPAATLHR
jgi:AraC-like DNA-binding protein